VRGGDGCTVSHLDVNIVRRKRLHTCILRKGDVLVDPTCRFQAQKATATHRKGDMLMGQFVISIRLTICPPHYFRRSRSPCQAQNIVQ